MWRVKPTDRPANSGVTVQMFWDGTAWAGGVALHQGLSQVGGADSAWKGTTCHSGAGILSSLISFWSTWSYLILIYLILFYSNLSSSMIFTSILFYSFIYPILFHSILFYSTLFYSILFYPTFAGSSVREHETGRRRYAGDYCRGGQQAHIRWGTFL